MEEATIDGVPAPASLRILVVMEHPGIGTLMPALKLLHDRGHQVRLAYESTKSMESHLELQALGEECPRMVFTQLPTVEASGSTVLAARLRRSIDYLRYLEPRYRDATQLRRRAARKAPKSIRRLSRFVSAVGPRGIAALLRGLQLVERCLAPPTEIERFLAEERPDVLIPTHLLPIGSPHADYLRGGNRLGIHTVFPVRGWDNLTNKGLLRDAPELLLAWNEFQGREAEELHRVPRERIRLTGAALCDHWFGWQPSRDRDTFCREVGLRADRPIVLYTCSSGFVARNNEADFVRRWIEQLRDRGGVFADAGFLIRPHPLNAAQWADADLDGDQVRVWPRFGEAPHDDASRRNFFDSIYHAAAVVGINTTSQIESAIVGRPVHTILADEFRETQLGTLHFHYLRAEGFGHLHVGGTFEDHAEQLEESLRGRDEDGRNERFLRRFVRPLGLDRSATEAIVEAIEELGSHPGPPPERGPVLAPLVRWALAPIAAASWRDFERRRGASGPDATPSAELLHVVRKRALHRTGAPVVAGPWLEDEVGELLYWIPFLRWVQGLDAGLRERLFIVSRGANAAWYSGIGAGRVDLEHLIADPDLFDAIGEGELLGPLRDDVSGAFEFGSRAFRVLPGALVAASRAELARLGPDTRVERRPLEFAPLARRDPPAALNLPDDFVAVRTGTDPTGFTDLLATRHATVALDGLDGNARAAVVPRARGFAGSFGADAVLSVLSGHPAVVLRSSLEQRDQDDMQLARSFLAGEQFGRLHVLEGSGSHAETAAQALQLLGADALLPV